MARTRYLKPGFFQNDRLAELSPLHRLLFAGLWTIADRAGRLEDRPKRIKGLVLPYDDADVDTMLTDLSQGDDPFIVRYERDGCKCIQIAKFAAHQNPHKKEPDSTIPANHRAKTTSPGITETSPGDSGPSPVISGPSPALNGEWGTLNGEWGMGKGQAADAAPDSLAGSWNAITSKPIPACQEVTAKRKRAALARLKERPLSEWDTIIARIEQSAFCRGENDRGWVATFDWLLQPDTAVKVLEGKYDNRSSAPKTKPLYTVVEIRHAAKSLGPNSWAAECVREHAAQCGDAQTHKWRMAEQIASHMGQKAAS